MKTRFNLMAIITAIAVCCSIASCKKIVVEGGDVDSDYITVSLGMTGDILEVIESPFTRAGEGESKDLYGIQVYSAPNKDLPEGQEVTWTNYAYGLFGSNENLTINLLKGRKYKFVATMVVDGQEKLKSYNGGTSFSFPFYVSGTNSQFGVIGTQFTYQHADYLSGLGGGTTYLLNGDSYSHPNVERYYGELVDYIPGMHGDKAIVTMKITSFKARFVASGILAVNGRLEVQMTGAPKMMLDLAADNKEVEDVFTFSNVKKAYETDNYTETITVTLNWHRTDGTVFPLGSHEITYKRNKRSTALVKIETENAEGELGIEIEDEEMTDDDDVVNIEDGEIVDTEVDTNS